MIAGSTRGKCTCPHASLVHRSWIAPPHSASDCRRPAEPVLPVPVHHGFGLSSKRPSSCLSRVAAPRQVEELPAAAQASAQDVARISDAHREIGHTSQGPQQTTSDGWPGHCCWSTTNSDWLKCCRCKKRAPIRAGIGEVALVLEQNLVLPYDHVPRARAGLAISKPGCIETTGVCPVDGMGDKSIVLRACKWIHRSSTPEVASTAPQPESILASV